MFLFDGLCVFVVSDEDALVNSKCPKNLELRWQTEVSSSIYANPLIADINKLVFCELWFFSIDLFLQLNLCYFRAGFIAWVI